jgi:ABC-type polysaccharide/polyol phosphate export permease
VLPITSVISNLYGFVFTLVAVVLVCFGFGVNPGFRLLLLVPATIMLVALTAGISMLLSGLHVYFRDVKFFLQALLSVWLFITPVLYPLAKATDTARMFLIANPMTGVVELFRASVTAEEHSWSISLVSSGVWIVATLTGALLLHRRYNRVFSDLL